MFELVPSELIQSTLNRAQGNFKHLIPKPIYHKPTFPTNARMSKPLPRVTGESVGVSSKALEEFFIELSSLPGSNPHALMVLRHGKVIAEGYFSPYRKNMWQVTHSICKCFTGTAVGFALEEGLFTLDDPITKFFVHELNLPQKMRYRDVTVRHLLTMSSGIAFDELSEFFSTKWVEGAFSSIPKFKPGARFAYNSMNSYLLASIVHKTSGQSLIEYLRPRLFEPLEFGPIAWEKSPDGTEKGGWGMYATIEDMTKIGLLYLQGGQYLVKGKMKQVVPNNWALAATTTQIDNGYPNEYGFQMWTCAEDNSFIMNGLFGQYVYCIPEHDIIVSMQAGSENLFYVADTFFTMRKYFANPKEFPKKLSSNRSAHKHMRTTLSDLHYSQPVGTSLPPVPTGQELVPFLNTTWFFPKNSLGLLPLVHQTMNSNFGQGIHMLRLSFANKRLILAMREGSRTLQIPIGLHYAMESEQVLGDEKFVLGTRAHMTQSPTGGQALRIMICPIESTSVRYILLWHQNSCMQMRLYEDPNLFASMDDALQQRTAASAMDFGFSFSTSHFSEWMQQSGFVKSRAVDVLSPTIAGSLVRPTRTFPLLF